MTGALTMSFCVHLVAHDQLTVNPKIVQDLLLHLNCYEFMGPDGICPRILKELAGIITKPLDDF